MVIYVRISLLIEYSLKVLHIYIYIYYVCLLCMCVLIYAFILPIVNNVVMIMDTYKDLIFHHFDIADSCRTVNFKKSLYCLHRAVAFYIPTLVHEGLKFQTNLLMTMLVVFWFYLLVFRLPPQWV